MEVSQDKPAWTACPPGVKITRAGVRYLGTACPLGAIKARLACHPGGKLSRGKITGTLGHIGSEVCGVEATFINICISNGSLKCHRVLIATTPSFGDKVTMALPLRPLYSNISLLSFPLFLRDSHFNCPRMPVILIVS